MRQFHRLRSTGVLAAPMGRERFLTSARSSASSVSVNEQAKNALEAARALLAVGRIPAALKRLDEIKAVTSVEGGRRLRGVDELRARCFLQDASLEGSPNVFAARQALLEEMRFFPDNDSADQTLSVVERACAPFFELPKEVATREPVFALVYDAVRQHTMLNWQRLLNLFVETRRACLESGASARAETACIVELGVAAGGSAVVMGVAAAEGDAARRKASGGSAQAERNRQRPLIVFDTFSGMPPPSSHDRLVDGLVTAENSHWSTGTCAAPVESVLRLAQRFGLEVQPVVGLFGEAPLPPVLGSMTAPNPKSILCAHIDSDWYESTQSALRIVLPRLVGKGASFVQLDDYGYWDGCRRAVDEVVSLNAVHWKAVDGNAVWSRV